MLPFCDHPTIYYLHPRLIILVFVALTLLVPIAGHQRSDHALPDDRDNHPLLLSILRARALPKLCWPGRATLAQLALPPTPDVQVLIFGKFYYLAVQRLFRTRPIRQWGYFRGEQAHKA